MKSRPSPSLIALSTTALALPGIAQADAPPAVSTVSYKISNYTEDDLSRSEAPFALDLERYDIDVHQFQLLAPVGRNYAVSVDANYETLTGAEIQRVINGEPPKSDDYDDGLGAGDKGESSITAIPKTKPKSRPSGGMEPEPSA